MSGQNDAERPGRQKKLEEDSKLRRAEEKRLRKREKKERRQTEKKRRSRVKLVRKTLLYAVSIAIVGGLVYGVYLASISSSDIGPAGSTHEHAVLAIFIDETPLDFSTDRFQVQDERAHFEEGDGYKIHKHATGMTLGFFLNTLDITLDSGSLLLYDGVEYANQTDKTVKFYVNGVANYEFGDYAINEQDEILISYGDDNPEEIQRQLEFVSDRAAELLSSDG